MFLKRALAAFVGIGAFMFTLAMFMGAVGGLDEEYEYFTTEVDGYDDVQRSVAQYSNEGWEPTCITQQHSSFWYIILYKRKVQ